MKRIAVLRWDKLPGFVTWEIPNMDELLADDRLVIEGFEARGHEAVSVVWNEAGVDWNRFDAALIRSTWDYIDDGERFLHVLAQIEASSCRLFNPLEAVRWNIDKNYLFDLEQAGTPIIPTFSTSRVAPRDLQDLFLERKWRSAVLKPVFGIGGVDSQRVASAEIERTLQSLAKGSPGQEYLVQPFIDSILSEGEWSFIYFNRQLSHVLLKKPAPNEYRVQGIYGGTVEAAEAGTRDLRQAQAIMERLPFDLVYARLDLVRVDGELAVMEVELIEPILSFNLVSEGVERLVDATLAAIERS